MVDRVPSKPGRVLITPEGGGAAYYATVTRADEPVQEGTPLNKASLLTDTVAGLFGLSATATPNDVLNAIKTQLNGKAPTNHRTTGTTYGAATGSYYGHVKLSDAIDSASGAASGVAATPAAVKAAIEAIEGKIKIEYGSMKTTSAGSFDIVFAEPFKSPPAVAVTTMHKIYNLYVAQLYEVTTGKARGKTWTISKDRIEAAGADIYWIAIGT